MKSSTETALIWAGLVIVAVWIVGAIIGFHYIVPEWQ